MAYAAVCDSSVTMMPFNYLLTNLLVDVPHAVGAIFVDEEGEAVEWVTRHNDPYDLKIEGAYHSVLIRRLAKLAIDVKAGKNRQLHPRRQRAGHVDAGPARRLLCGARRRSKWLEGSGTVSTPQRGRGDRARNRLTLPSPE
jgi:hypothetical protein